MFVASTELDEQLSAVSKKFSLTYGEDRMRCSVCNGKLAHIDWEKAKEIVPALSIETAKQFWICESCGKTYWDGTHWKGIMGRFERLGLIEVKTG